MKQQQTHAIAPAAAGPPVRALLQPSSRFAFAAAVLLGWALTGCAPGKESHARPTAKATSPISLSDVTESAGLKFQWGHNGKTPLTNLETFGCGCAFLDYDRDGHLDIFLVGEPRSALFRNRGDGTYEDVSQTTGIAGFEASWKGIAVGDITEDGYPDLVVTGFHKTIVLENLKGKAFKDITARSGVINREWGASAGFADLDNDGDLDLYICNYVIWGPQEQQLCELAPGVRSGCPPSVYRAERGRLFKNEGKGKFKDVTKSSGVMETEGKSLVVGFCDIDHDGKTDFYIGNDGTPADLFHNLGNLRFRNDGLARAIAMNKQGSALAAMGIDWADVDRDGRPDAAVSAFSNESFALFRNLGELFSEDSREGGIAEATYKPLGFGTKFVDLDNDGWDDLIFACGHVYDTTHLIDAETTYRQPLMIFHNQGGWKYAEAKSADGEGFSPPVVGRGLAAGDYDRDGRQDLLLVDYEGRPYLLKNTSGGGGNWLQIAAKGPKGNPEGFGAVISVEAAGKKLWSQITPVSSYLSSSEPVAHIGLGAHSAVGRVQVKWPGGKTLTLSSPGINRRLVVDYEKAG